MKTNLLKLATIAALVAATSQPLAVSAACEVCEVTASNTRSVAMSMAAVDVLPSFPGGVSGLVKYLDRNIGYHSLQGSTPVTGKAYVSFVVNEEGCVENVKVLSGLAPELDSRLETAINNMPSWNPGTLQGNSVKTNYVLPVRFVRE